jgi:hypothetical protein
MGLDHPHCLKHYLAWEENGFLFVQMELCKQSLRDFIDNIDDMVPEELIWHFLLDVALVRAFKINYFISFYFIFDTNYLGFETHS